MLENFDSETPPPTTASEWVRLFRIWEKSYASWLETDVETRPYRGEDEATACYYVATGAARSTLDWCKANPENGSSEINEKLCLTAWLVHDLYLALRPITIERSIPKLKSKQTFWQHVDLGRFLSVAGGEEKDFPLDRRAVKDLSNTYIGNVWMQNPYLDWVFVDSLMFGELIDSFQMAMRIRYGFGYTLFGKQWKAILFRMFSLPATFILGWVAPGVFCWWLYGWLPIPSLVTAAIYYVLSLLIVLRYFGRLILYRLRVGKTPRQERIDRLNKMELAYAELREETIHVPSLRRAIDLARDVGVLWDPQIFSILDSISAKSPTTWNRRFPGGPDPFYWKARALLL